MDKVRLVMRGLARVLISCLLLYLAYSRWSNTDTTLRNYQNSYSNLVTMFLVKLRIQLPSPHIVAPYFKDFLYIDVGI